MLNYSIFPATWDIWKSCTCDAYLSTNAWRSQVHQTEPLFSSFCISTWNHNEVSKWQNCLLQQLQHRLKNSKAEAQQINGSPHIISVTCNLFSTVIRYLQREIIRKKSLMLFLWLLLFAEDLPTARTHYERDGALTPWSAAASYANILQGGAKPSWIQTFRELIGVSYLPSLEIGLNSVYKCFISMDYQKKY